MVTKPETIFFVTRKMVFLVKKIFSFAKTRVSGIETMVSVMHTIFTTTVTTVTAEQKMVSVTPTIFGVLRQELSQSSGHDEDLDP